MAHIKNRSTVSTDQLDLLDMHERDQRERKLAGAIPTLFATDVRGIAARWSAARAWLDEYQSFNGWAVAIRAWLPQDTIPWFQTTTCQAAVLTACLGCVQHKGQDCFCVGGKLGADTSRVFRGACRGCDWESERVHGWKNSSRAALDALDHAFPGWRSSPVITWSPMGPQKVDRWRTEMLTVYGDRPEGWPVIAEPADWKVPGQEPVEVSAWPQNAWHGLTVSPAMLD